MAPSCNILVPRPPKVCFLEVFSYIKPTKKHTVLGGPGWLSFWETGRVLVFRRCFPQVAEAIEDLQPEQVGLELCERWASRFPQKMLGKPLEWKKLGLPKNEKKMGKMGRNLEHPSFFGNPHLICKALWTSLPGWPQSLCRVAIGREADRATAELAVLGPAVVGVVLLVSCTKKHQKTIKSLQNNTRSGWCWWFFMAFLFQRMFVWSFWVLLMLSKNLTRHPQRFLLSKRLKPAIGVHLAYPGVLTRWIFKPLFLFLVLPELCKFWSHFGKFWSRSFGRCELSLRLRPEKSELLKFLKHNLQHPQGRCHAFCWVLAVPKNRSQKAYRPWGSWYKVYLKKN